MASHDTNQAVVLYRKTLKAERKASALNDELGYRVSQLGGEDFKDYLRMTQEIDKAVDAVADASEATIAVAANNAGRDK